MNTNIQGHRRAIIAHENSNEIHHANAIPVRFVARDKLQVQWMSLIDIVGGAIIEDHAQAHVIRIIDDFAGCHGGVAGADEFDAGNFSQSLRTKYSHLSP